MSAGGHGADAAATRAVRGAADVEIGRVLDFLEGRMGAREFFESRFRTCPPTRAEASRLVWLGDRIVSHARVYRRDLRLRGAVIPSGHLAEVCTHEDFRRQGHGRALLQDCAEFIRSQAWPVACVYSGVGHFYACEDWVPFPLVRTSVATAHWQVRPAPDVHVRRYERGRDDDAVAQIYNEYNQARNLSALRDAEYWRLHYSWIVEEDQIGFLIAEKRGAPVGYCRCFRGALCEYGVRPGHDDAGIALIDACVRRARISALEQLRLTLPVDEAVVTALSGVGCSTVRDGLMHLRVVDLKGILDIALQTSGDRLRDCGCPRQHTIALEVLGQKCLIRFSRSGAEAECLPAAAPATRLAQTEFLKLVFGARLEADLSAFSPDDRLLLTGLFPADGPVYWYADVV